jgi:integrase
LLWIADAKTEAGKRAIEVPHELRPYLLTRSQGKPHDALLLPAKQGGPHWRDWVAEQTRRLCRLARVPVICAHSLRGFMATVAIQAGRASQDVIATMGHRDISTTLRSYAAPGSAQIAEQRRALDVLGAPPSNRTVCAPN